MRKDIEWLKGRFRGRKIFKSQNDREIGYNMAIDEFSEYVDQLEMETVEITEEQVMEWLDNNDFYDHATAETVLANAVDKGELGYYGTKYSVVEKPTIPKFVVKTNLGTYLIIDTSKREWDYTSIPPQDDDIQYAYKFDDRSIAEGIAKFVEGKVEVWEE